MDYTIIIDTREQKPLWNKNVVVKKLDVGDYSIEGFEDKIAIERKSLGDLFGTLGGGHKRFKKELERSKSYDYFAIVIEGSYTNCINKDFPNSYFSKMRGYVITSILFTLHVKYDINIFFANNRIESKKIIKELFKSYYKLYNNKSKN
jgi:ERCC4-type nuclease